MALVFISYSRRDIVEATAVEDAFTKRGIPCFRDEADIRPGDPFPERIGEKIRDSSAVVVLLSENTAGSEWVDTEILLARLSKKWLVPYRIDGSTTCPKHLQSHVQEVRTREALVRALLPTTRIEDISVGDAASLMVPGLPGVYSSFLPARRGGGEMLRLRIPTTYGWIHRADKPDQIERADNHVYVIRDPIRPFEIQIGETRALRPGGIPGAIELDPTVSDPRFLRGTWMQLIRQPAMTRWERAVLAEIVPDPDLLRDMYESEDDKWVRGLIGRNPATPDDIKQKECLFCNGDFLVLRQRQLPTPGPAPSAIIINNDFPFGPHFHYVVIPTDPVHSWESVSERHLMAMNQALHDFLGDPSNRHGSAGVQVGFNSSVRHLVVGAKTHASAGASISHIHKQAWGMVKGSLNLGDQLARVCDAYRSRGIDYLASYLDALRDGGMVLAEDDFIVLYVPLGQIATHELQIMVKARKKTFCDLTIDELRSISFAELAVARLYAALGINSYNEIVLTQEFGATEGANFRLILTFVTREIDLAVSELNLLYVTDTHPYDTVVAASHHWASIVKENGLPFSASPP